MSEDIYHLSNDILFLISEIIYILTKMEGTEKIPQH